MLQRGLEYRIGRTHHKLRRARTLAWHNRYYRLLQRLLARRRPSDWPVLS